MSPHCNFKRVMLEWNVISIFCNRTYRKCQHRVSASYILVVEWVQLFILFCVSSLFSKLFVDKLSILFILLMQTSARTWCSGRTWRERVGREVGGGIGMGKTCEPKAFSFQCMTEFPTNKKKKKKKNIFFPFTFKISIDPISLSQTKRFLNVAFKNQTTSWSNHKINSLYTDVFSL